MVAQLGGSASTYRLYTSNIGSAYDNGSGVSYTPTSTGGAKVLIVVYSGATCNNLIFKPMLESGSTKHDYEPYTNGASPNPTYPQDIEVVTGQQEVLVRGKNLLKPTLQANGTDFVQVRCSVTLQDDEFTFVASGTDMYVGSVANVGTSYTNNLGYLIKLPSNASKIWVTFTNTSFTGSYITWYDENKISLGYGLAHQTGDSVVSGAKYCSIRIGMGNSVSGTTYKTKIMVNEGTTASAWQPYQEQTKIVNLSSKNLFDKDNANIIDNAYIGSTNIASINGAKTLYIECEPNTTYTISRTAGKGFVVATTIYKPTLNTSIGGRIVDNEASSITITTNNVAKYLCVFYYLSGTDTLSEETIRNSIMIELGSTATTYEPYYNYELAKIGTYQDRIYKNNDKWYIEKNIGKYTFTGNETYITWNSNRVVISNIPTDYKKVANSEVALVKCTCYTAINRDSSNAINNSITFYSASDSASGTIINDSVHNTNTLLKEFMTSTHPSMYYVLATPTYEEITNTNLLNQLNELEKMMSYNGQTNINISGNLPMILSASALKGESE